MMTIILLGVLSFLLLLGIAFFLQKVHFQNISLAFLSGYLVLFLFTLSAVYIEDLWNPTMGYERLFFLFVITLASLLNAIVVGVMVYKQKIQKMIFVLSLTFIFLAPFFAYCSFSVFQWYHFDRYKSTYCIESENNSYILRLNSESSVATISKQIGPHSYASYFHGYYNRQGDTAILEGEQFIAKDSLENSTYTLTGQQLIGFPEKGDTTQLHSCH
ncbi:hypothetical protein [Fodinibius halophilus]|uniref:Uncharacterized protein n=1 Tax=Fodinibius halophilus TaxID=1736908 RepID=A0A6M1TIN2_9BACT|nr:hypothetical protein [Fodinibius halophilus]NGP88460.1 hypothetical protein [Fodinibius halophilus]